MRASNKQIGKAIKVRRKQLNLTQKDLEDYSGISYAVISSVESGKNTTLATLFKLMEPLGLTLEVKVINKL